ncbi:dTDP-4-dehydrorhamnose reductase [Actinacidiphila yeochonensis]|uniref:dTDP-4-dehydrorhamnose reductase n=1 Tax=Actinacidiphila yeochonensis TaxID=89050 RepID=UPI00055CB6E0|nr:dTDP-4-dehydrorhamnose reductase [Actinacidiphila yeochonensis]
MKPPHATWLVTGAGGMLGQDLLARMRSEPDTEVVGLGSAALDITDPAAVAAAVAEYQPVVVVNCAAWTAVDNAETQEADAARVNGEGPGNLARACAEHGAKLLHVSTDYVFPGDADRPYPEDAPTGPRGAYGRTKLAGEQAVLATLPDDGYVVRTAWLYGAGGRNFARTMIRLEGVKDTLDVVDDQRGQPTWTVDLADRLVRLGHAALRGAGERTGEKAAPAGVYHGTSGGEVTWFGFAREIFRLLGADPERVRPTTTEALGLPAPRPAYSVLGHDRWQQAGIEPVRDWRSALAEAFPALVAAERG